MTKAEEIAALTAFTHSLPVDSYLRPWLESILPEIEHDIRCDFPVSPSLQLTRVECDRVLADSKRHCESVRARAEAEADRIRQEARQSAASVSERIYRELSKCARQLGYDAV